MDKNQFVVGMTRREMLKGSIAGTAGLALASYGCSRTDVVSETAGAALPNRAASIGGKGRAKSVIQIWMWGGPSHLDTFDPKPEAGNDYCGPLDKPIPTNIDGIRIGQLLPKLANIADKYSIIRSMTHGNNSHETASYITQTSRKPDRLAYPCIGAVVSLFKGYDHGYKGIIPPYIVLTSSQGRFAEAGFLGDRYKPFVTGGDPNKPVFAVEGIVAEGISDQRQISRRELLHQLDSLGNAMPENPHFQQFDNCEKGAYDMMFGEIRNIFDLSKEKNELRDLYGRNTFGQSCLMARRMVEQGVPYITINYPGWDTHKNNFGIMQRRLPEMDQGMAALFQDLSDRGLLETTIVWWSGEFGRTPKVQWEPPWNGGRGHWGNCFSALVAGGGFKGGHAIGSSDERGLAVASRPVYPRDLIGSIYELLGIDPDSPLPNHVGLDLRLLPPSEEGAKSVGLLKEIMQ